MRKILSISIAAYNVEKFLDKTLRSLVVDKNIMDLIEVIIIDDGSVDKTNNIAKSYCERYPDTFILVKKENGGYGSTINSAIRIAKGEYFKLLDGDDWFETKNIAGFIGYLSICSSDLVITPYIKCYKSNRKIEVVDTHTNLSSEIQVITDNLFLDDILMHEITVKTSILLMNNIAITEKCFYTDNEYALDVLINSKTVSKFNSEIYCYRLGEQGQSVSIQGMIKHFDDAVIMANMILNRYDDLDFEKKYIRKKINIIFTLLYESYLIKENEVQSKQELRRFEQRLKNEFPKVYDATNEVKKIEVLRRTHYILWKLIKKYVVQKIKDNGK